MDQRRKGRELKQLRVFALVVLGGCMSCCAGWAVIALARGSYTSFLVAFGLTVCLCAPLVMWIIKPNVVARGTFDAAGTTIRPDHRIDKLAVVCFVTGTVSLGFFGVLGVMGKLDIPIPQDIARMYTPIFIAPAAVFLVGFWFIVRRRGMSYVLLTVDGFEFVEHFRARRGEWSQVVAVANEVANRPEEKSPLVMVMANAQLKILSESAWYTPGGRALLELMRFYWQHPEYRMEFTDGRAVERLQHIQVALGPGLS